MELREYQLDCIEAVLNELLTSQTALAALPTGGGKTFVFSHLILRAMELKPTIKVKIVMGRIDLVKQTERALSRVIPQKHIGVYCGSLGRKELSRAITVASIQSISDIDIPHVDLLIIDEVHNFDQGDGNYLRFIEKIKNPKVKIVGFTATPFRSDGFIYGDKMLFKNLCYTKSIKEMIAMGFLCEPKLKGSAHAFNVSRLRVRGGDYRAEDVSELVSDKNIVEDQIKDALSRMGDRKSVVWACANIDHCNLIANELMRLGEYCTTVHSKLSKETRNLNLGNFIGGSSRHLSFVSILSEGFDHPPIDCVVLMRPTRSPVLYVQTVGRGLRIWEGKSDCLVLDYGQVVKTLGPLDSPRVRSKSDGGGPPPVKECPECFTIVLAGARVCPDCEHPFPEPISTIERLDREAASSEDILSGAPKPQTILAKFAVVSMHQSKSGNVCVKILYAMHDFKNAYHQRFGDTEYFVTTSPWAMERLEGRLSMLELTISKIPFDGEYVVKGDFEIVKSKDGQYDRILSVKKTKSIEPLKSEEDASFDFGFDAL